MSDMPATRRELLSDEQFRRLIAVVIAVVTALTGGIAYLQSDADSRDGYATRDSYQYAIQAMGMRVSGDARVDYDVGAALQAWRELDLLAYAANGYGDPAAVERYQDARDSLRSHTPLLAPPYFDEETGTANIARYEADTYLVTVTDLSERFAAASSVQQAWDAKANTYIVHLTLLAVSLFLFGMSITIAVGAARAIFAGSGAAVTLVALAWAATTIASPVEDLRAQSGAIEALAEGVGLAHQERYEEAIASFDRALAAAPGYTRALVERGGAYASLGDIERSVRDYEAARAAGDTSALVAGELAWMYYQLGRFDDAVAMNQAALAVTPDELWVQFDLALSLLAAGRVDAAQAAYAEGIAQAEGQVAAAHAAGTQPSSTLWWSLDDAAVSLEGLLLALDSDDAVPPRTLLAAPEVIRPAAETLITRLKSAAVGLELTGTLPSGSLHATISPLSFGLVGEDGEVVAEGDTFGPDTTAVAVQFDYAGMRDGQEIMFKVFVDGEEDPSWRLVTPWELGAEGSAMHVLSPGATDTFALWPGEYAVDVYVDSHLAQTASFTVEE